MAQVTITWKAFGDATSATFDIPENGDAINICNMLFRQTNLYEGHAWDILESLLPENRTHTALSVGDEITVNGITHRCESIGWAEVSLTA
jgi:hypothetical protein